MADPPSVPQKPSVTAFDVVVNPTSAVSTSPQAGNFTGTPGTGGTITVGVYHGLIVPEPHRVFKWDVFLPEIGGVTRPIVQAVNPIFDNTKPDPHPIGGRHMNIADWFDTTDNELTLVMYNDAYTSRTGSFVACTPLEYILAWKKLIRPYGELSGIDDGTYNYPITYWKDIYVYFQDMQNNIVYTLWYKQCFPTTTAPVHLDYENPGRSTISQAFSVNRVVLTRGPSFNTTGSSVLPGPNFLQQVPELSI